MADISFSVFVMPPPPLRPITPRFFFSVLLSANDFRMSSGFDPTPVSAQGLSPSFRSTSGPPSFKGEKRLPLLGQKGLFPIPLLFVQHEVPPHVPFLCRQPSRGRWLRTTLNPPPLIKTFLLDQKNSLTEVETSWFRGFHVPPSLGLYTRRFYQRGRSLVLVLNSPLRTGATSFFLLLGLAGMRMI